MSYYCWSVLRAGEPARYVALGRQGSLNKAKAAAKRNHEEGCLTSAWRFKTDDPVWVYVPRRDGCMVWKRRAT